MGDNFATVRSIQALAAFVAQLPMIGAQAYANGGNRGRAIVERHFTAGNDVRNGWAALSPKYAAFKQGLVKSTRQNLKAAGRVVPRGGLPMLNGPSTLGHTGGLLRQAVTARKHSIVLNGDTAMIFFRGLPDYADYLHTGTDKMPARSPVEPSAADLDDVGKEMKKALDAAVGAANRGVPITVGIPGKARLAA